MKSIKYSRTTVVNILLMLATLVLSTATHADNGANTYYVLNPRLSSSTLNVVSLSDDNKIVAGNTTLTLNRNESGIIPGADLVAGTRITGTGAFSAGSTLSTTDSPVPAGFAGTRFALPRTRPTSRNATPSLKYLYHLLSPEGNATVRIINGTDTQTLALTQGQVQTFDTGSNSRLAAGINGRLSISVESDRPILLVHEASSIATGRASDVYPVAPAAKELWGVRSGSVTVGALEDATTLKVYADDGSRAVYTLNAGEGKSISLNSTGNNAQGAGSALHIISDKPVSAVQFGDGDGGEASAFLSRPMLATHLGIATDSQYIAIACTRSNTRIRLRQNNQADQIRFCNGNEKSPGKVFFGSTTNGVQIAAGSTVEANAPIFAIVEDRVTNAEHNVFGLLEETSAYYVLNPRLSNGELHVVSLVNNNTIQAGNTLLSLNRHESGVIPSADLSQGTRISGSGPFSAGSEVNGTDTPPPANLAGKQFVIPYVPFLHSYNLLSPHGDANVQIANGNSTPQNIALTQGNVLNVPGGFFNTAATLITSDLPILVVYRGGRNAFSTNFTYPVPPATETLRGVNTSTTIIAAQQVNTTVTVYASNGEPSTFVLDAGGRKIIRRPATLSAQGQGPGLYIVADKPIAAVQLADGDGREITAYLSDAHLANHYSIPVDSQYVAITCGQPNTLIRLRSTTGVTQEQLCSANGSTPGKAYFGSTTNGVNISAGSIIESTQPIYLITETSASNDEHNLFGRAGSIEAFDANAYYIVNPNISQDSLSVVSLTDNNSIFAGNTQLTLDINQSGIIPGSDLTPGTRLSGSGAFSAASAANGTDSPVPATLAGTRFAIPHIRAEHTYYMLSPYSDAVVNISAGASASQTVTLTQGQMQAVDAGAEILSAVISSDNPILIVHEGTRNNGAPLDVYPVVPATTELWGVQTRNAWIGAVEDNTTVTVYSDTADPQVYTLNAGDIQLNVSTDLNTQGDGLALHIVADKPIAAVQSADGDGVETTAFLDRKHLATHIGIPVDSQYISVICTEPNTIVRLSDGEFVDEERCSASSDGTQPASVFFGSTTNGANISSSAIIEASKPVYTILESSAANDEHNIFGRLGNDFVLLADIEKPPVPDPQPDGYTDTGTPLTLQAGRAARAVNTLGMFTLTNRPELTILGSGNSAAGSDDEWNETAVRHVLRTFAFGGLGVREAQITQWAAMSPQDAIKEILNFDESNPLLAPIDPLDDTWMQGGTLAAAADFWGSDDSGNTTPQPLRTLFTASVPDQNVGGPSRNEARFYWHRLVLTPGMNPFRQYIGLWETNYHLAVIGPAGDIRRKLHFYDAIMNAHASQTSYDQVLATAAKAPAVALHYGHIRSTYTGGTCNRCNEDFAREFHQLYFGIVGEADPDYYENVTIKNSSLAFTGQTILNQPDLGYFNSATNFRSDLHFQGPVEIHHRIVGGYDMSERLDAMAAIDIEEPESLNNLPVIIISGLADENMPEWKKQELRHAWATMGRKDFLTFIRNYAISDLFHFGKRVFHPNVFSREVSLAAKAVRSDAVKYFFVRANGTADRNLFTRISAAQRLALFLPEKGVFGHRTGLEDAASTTSYATHFNRIAQVRSYQSNQGIDWSKFIPPDSGGGWTAEGLALWFWNDFYPGETDNGFDPLVRANLLSLLATSQDLARLAENRGIAGVSEDTVITEDLLASNTALAALVESLATTTIDLTDSTAENIVALAMNFIAVTPHAFADF